MQAEAHFRHEGLIGIVGVAQGMGKKHHPGGVDIV
jgi:hypothetical protein